jgi:hypothetical protein
MNPAKLLKSLEKRIWAILTLRQTIWWSAVWFFVLGAIVLGVRMTTTWPTHYLVAATAVVFPIGVALGIWQWRTRPAEQELRGVLDRHNQAGGMIVAESDVDMGAWKKELPVLALPEFRWHSRRPLMVFTCAAVFLAATFLIPEKHLGFGADRTLEIGSLVGEINEELEVLEEEQILEEKKSNDLQNQLKKLEHDADARDPAKTWEALDHLKQANSDLAKQAAEEAMQKMNDLKHAEALAGALGMLPEPNEALSAAGMQDLAAMLDDAKLENGLLKGEIPKDLLEKAKKGKLTPEQLKKLLEAIKNNKGDINDAIAKLVNIRLLDVEKLGECQGAGQCPNPGDLAKFLAANCNGTNSCTNGLSAFVAAFCSGIKRGRADAPITWMDPSTFDGTSSKNQVLPMGSLSAMKDAKFVGISRSAPEVTGAQENAGSGALSGTAAGGGSAQVQQVLPRHKGAVQRFFKREN